MPWVTQDPFAFWQDKDVYKSINDLSVTEQDISQAIYMNDNNDPCRITTLTNKVMTGQPVKMMVIGGSNSAGGGIKDHRRLFHQLFSEWWNHVISPSTRSKLTVENLSLGGTGSDFFTFCLQNLISYNEEPDIVIIELSVNDYGYLHGETARPMELLTRRVLSLSSFPLVLYVSLVDLVKKGTSLSSIKNPRCYNMEDLGQRELARHYGITLLSWRDILCPLNPVKRIREADIRPGMVNSDHLHIDVKGHAQVALMIIRYFQNFLQRAWQLYCTVQDPWNTKPSIDKTVPLFVSTETLISKPLCWSLISPDWRMSRESQSLQVKVLERRGFYEVTSQSTYAKMARTGADRSDSFGGWQSTKGESYIEFFFSVPKTAGHTKKWSVGIILRHLQCGGIKVWLDENERKSLTMTGNTYGRIHLLTRVHFLKARIKSGDHKMQIKTEGRKGFEVLLSGIVLGPVGMKDIKGYKPANTLQKVWSLDDYKMLLLDH